MRNILILVFLIASLPTYSQIQKSFPSGNPIIGSELETNFTEIENRLEGFVNISGNINVDDASTTTVATVTLQPGIYSIHGAISYDRQSGSADAISDMYTFITDSPTSNPALGTSPNIQLLAGPIDFCHRMNYNVPISLSDVRATCGGFLIKVLNSATDIYIKSYVNFGGSDPNNGWSVTFKGYAKRH